MSLIQRATIGFYSNFVHGYSWDDELMSQLLLKALYEDLIIGFAF